MSFPRTEVVSRGGEGSSGLRACRGAVLSPAIGSSRGDVCEQALRESCDGRKPLMEKGGSRSDVGPMES